MRFGMVAILGMAVALSACQTTKGYNPDDTPTTWEQGRVYIQEPDTTFGIGDEIGRSFANGKFEERRAGRDMPVVIYMHGCSGISHTMGPVIEKWTDLGFVVFLPDSYKRERTKSCDPSAHKGGGVRGAPEMRGLEAAYAVNKVRSFPWATKVVLAGFSEGGMTVATYNGPRVDARVTDGWPCHAGSWDDWNGLNASSDEWVLSLASYGDPWAQKDFNRGVDCGAFMSGDRQTSVYFRDSGRATIEGSSHNLMYTDAGWVKVVEFLKRAGITE